MIARRQRRGSTSARRASLVLLVAMLALLSACGGEQAPPPAAAGEPPPGAADRAAQDADVDIPEPTVTPLAQSSVRVYFPSSSDDGLIAENRDIFETTTPGDRAKQIVAGLIEGPESDAATRAVPRGTRLRQAYVLPSGVAYLDFSRELVDGLGGGSMRELLTVYAIVDSVARNIPEIKAVGLLVEGNIPDTLNGHLDLRYPLRPNYTMVLTQAFGDTPQRSVPTPLAPGKTPDADSATAPPVRLAGNQ